MVSSPAPALADVSDTAAVATFDAPADAQDGAVPRGLEQTFTHRLHTLNKLTDKVTQAAFVSATGLPLGEGRCLTAVGAFAPLSVKDLAQMANVDKGQASRAAQSLVDKGLVRKNPSTSDARGVVLTFTPEGEALCCRLMGVVQTRNDEIVGCLTPAERRQFDQLLTRLVTHARALADARGTDETETGPS